MTDESEHTLRVSPAYAFNQLLRALSSDTDTADAKATQWRRVLTGMFDGTLRPGSRTPVADIPAWVTLEVVHGGFATGAFVVGGPLEPHELDLLQRIDRPAGVTERAALNAYFLGTDGRTDLRLRPLYAAVYRAFRRRRSLLLLNLASQVRLEELPWMDALTPWIGASDAHGRRARRALTQATQVAVTSFPQTLLPNQYRTARPGNRVGIADSAGR